ncbi:MAG TPA: TerC family protein [Chloroflexia bacterium]
METVFLALFNIIIIDLVLSGDNAVVIGMAVRKLPPRQKRVAVLLGGGLAIVLRIVLTALATFLLQVPLLQLIGGLVLVWITYHLLAQDDVDGAAHRVSADMGMANALRTIIIADITMSTDNVLAVGAAAQGDLVLLLFGLTLSMVILVLGGTLVSVLMNKLTWLTYVGAAVLVLLAGDMIASDKWLLDNHIISHDWWVRWVFTAIVGVVVAGALYWRHLRKSREAPQMEAQ